MFTFLNVFELKRVVFVKGSRKFALKVNSFTFCSLIFNYFRIVAFDIMFLDYKVLLFLHLRLVFGYDRKSFTFAEYADIIHSMRCG